MKPYFSRIFVIVNPNEHNDWYKCNIFDSISKKKNTTSPNFYDEREKVKPKLYCRLNKRVCLYSKFCIKANKHIPNDGMENCFMALQEEKKKIPNGAYYVRCIRKGYLYVELDNNHVIKVKNTLDKETDYVYLY